MQKVTKKKIDIAVIGDGVTARSASFHLGVAGIKKVIRISPTQRRPGVSFKIPGILASGQYDNYTRVVNAHGREFAKLFWALGDQAFRETVAFMQKHGVSVSHGERLRIIDSLHESEEVQIAVKMLNEDGFCAQLSKDFNVRPKSSSWINQNLELQFTSDVACCDLENFLEVLGRGVEIIDDQVIAIRALPHEMELIFASGGRLSCEVVFACNHLGVSELLPQLAPVLVPISDQWFSARILKNALRGDTAPSMPSIFSVNHGLIWGCLAPTSDQDLTVTIGGGRFLRPFAGVGDESATYLPQVEQYLVNVLRKISKGLDLDKIVSGEKVRRQAILDCRPCDELPLMGPMYGEPRILLATGYMGHGITMGFLAGRLLSELAAYGRCSDLPRRFYPERQRSLPDSGTETGLD